MTHLLFDLDGTISDSGPGIIHCAQDTLAQFGLPVPEYAQMHFLVGPPLRDSLLRLGFTDENMEQAVEVYRQAYVAYGQYENTPYPGIETLFQHLKAMGHRLYIATSKPEVMAMHILAHFGLDRYFDIICGADLAGERLTKSAVLTHLLKSLPNGEKKLMIGDTIYDVEGAKALGLPCVGVAWGYGDLDEMRAAGALAIAADMTQLCQIIANF